MLCMPVMAQDARQRTPETIVQDVLALVPIQKQADFNNEMKPLVEAAPKSITTLAAMLKPAAQQVNAKVEYAIHGAVAYAGTSSKYAEAVREGLKQAIAAQADKDMKQFLENEMRLLSPTDDVTYTAQAGATPYAQAWDKLKELGSNAGPEIVKAVKSKDHALRMQALKFASANGLADEALAAQVVKKYKSLPVEAKCDLLSWLGDNKLAGQEALLTKAVGEGGKTAAAAIEALGKIGGENAVSTLISQLGGDNDAAALSALASVKTDLTKAVPAALEKAGAAQQTSLLKLAAARRVKSAYPIVSDLCKQGNAEAIKALAGIVTDRSTAEVAKMLDAATDANVGAFQTALKASVAAIYGKAQYQALASAMSEAQHKDRFYAALAQTNTDESVAALEKIGDAAIAALGQSKNYKAASALLAAGKKGNEGALMNYVRLVSDNEQDVDERCAKLTDAFALAKQAGNKKAILSKLALTPTRNAFLLAGKQLDNKELAYEAAVAQKNIIAKTTEDIEYDIVKDNLEKCMAIFKATGDADDGYAVDELRQKLSEMQPVPLYVLSDEEKKEGWELLFDGSNLDNFVGNKVGYVPINGCINVTANYGNESNLYTKKEYRDFIFRFEFCFLRGGVNNGVGIRTPMGVDAAYDGMCECQILDHDDPIYAGLREYQVHGSVYGVIPAKRIKHKPLGEWSEEEIRVKGNHITVIVNGETIVDGDIKEACKGHNVAPDGSETNPYTVDHRNHPGMFNKTGHIGFLGHGAGLKLRAVRVLDLTKKK